MNGNIPVNIAVYNTDMGGCQNYGSFMGTLNIICRIIIGTQKIGTIILTATHIEIRVIIVV